MKIDIATLKNDVQPMRYRTIRWCPRRSVTCNVMTTRCRKL